MNKDYTQQWQEYETCKDYNNRINLYSRTELNWNFYNAKQWIGITTNGLSKWTFNICRAAINYFVAYIMSQKVKMQYSAENIPDEPEDEREIKIKETCELLSSMAEMKWEKDKMDTKLRNLMLDGANTGDFAAYVYWDPNKETGQLEKGDFCTEIVDNVNVMFGNPNNPLVEAQPYILVIKRDTVAELKKRAKANKIPQDKIDQITSDQENTYQSGEYGKIELDNKGDTGKALSILKFWKKDGQVWWNEATKHCPITEDVALGIKRYPIAWGNWESIKNSYHGMAVIDGIIDNQISINQLFAMVSYWMKMSAFGKVIYDGTRVTEGWSNKLGEAIKANGDVTGIVQQLQAGNFNAAVMTIIDMAIKYTKEFIGANDALTGQINPEQASGVAIIAAGKQASIPMGNPMAARDQFVEDLGLIWGEFFLRKYKNRKVSFRKEEKMVTGDYSSEGMEDILLSCSVDVGPSSYFSEISNIQTLDNLLNTEKITILQYLKRMPNGVIIDKQGLIDDIETEQELASNREAEYEMMAQIIETYVPPEEQEAIMQMLMGEQQNMQGANTLPQ